MGVDDGDGDGDGDGMVMVLVMVMVMVMVMAMFCFRTYLVSWVQDHGPAWFEVGVIQDVSLLEGATEKGKAAVGDKGG